VVPPLFAPTRIRSHTVRSLTLRNVEPPGGHGRRLPLSCLRLGDPFRQPRCRFAPTTGSLQSRVLAYSFPSWPLETLYPPVRESQGGSIDPCMTVTAVTFPATVFPFVTNL